MYRICTKHRHVGMHRNHLAMFCIERYTYFRMRSSFTDSIPIVYGEIGCLFNINNMLV